MPDSSPLADFFSASWAAYRTLVEHDYLWHTMAGHALRATVDERFGASTPIRFLDLACGDSASISRALLSRPLKCYVGVDQSEPALAAAVANVVRLAGDVRLVPSDVLNFLQTSTESFDVIYIGLSAHHFGRSGLPGLFEAIHERLAPTGIFIAYEPFLMWGEARQDYVNRFAAMASALWIKMTAEQRTLVCNHVAECDHPVHLETWNAEAETAGLSRARIAMRSPDFMCQLVVHFHSIGPGA